MGRIITRPRTSTAAQLLRHDIKPRGDVVIRQGPKYANRLKNALLNGYIDASTRQRLTINYASSYPKFSENNNGDWRLNGDQTILFENKQTLNNFTLYMYVLPLANQYNSGYFGNFDGSWNTILVRKNTNTWQFYAKDSTGSQQGPAQVTDSSVSIWRHVVVRLKDNGSTSTFSMKVDDTEGSTTATFGSINLQSVTSLGCGYAGAASQRGVNAIFRFVYFFDVFIPDNDLVDIRINPYQYAKPLLDAHFRYPVEAPPVGVGPTAGSLSLMGVGI